MLSFCSPVLLHLPALFFPETFLIHGYKPAIPHDIIHQEHQPVHHVHVFYRISDHIMKKAYRFVKLADLCNISFGDQGFDGFGQCAFVHVQQSFDLILADPVFSIQDTENRNLP